MTSRRMNNGLGDLFGSLDNVEYSVNIIGAGGIASWVLHGLVRPARRFAQGNGFELTIRVHDSDRWMRTTCITRTSDPQTWARRRSMRCAANLQSSKAMRSPNTRASGT